MGDFGPSEDDDHSYNRRKLYLARTSSDENIFWAISQTVGWRLQDLLFQSKMLSDSNQLLGARILLRSAFETLAVLIHLNQLMRNVVSEKMDFHGFSGLIIDDPQHA